MATASPVVRINWVLRASRSTDLVLQSFQKIARQSSTKIPRVGWDVQTHEATFSCRLGSAQIQATRSKLVGA